MRIRFRVALGALMSVSFICSEQSWGQTQQKEKSEYTLVNPTPDDRLRELSTDRPDTTESPYTVDAGHLQLEMSAIDFGTDRYNRDSQSAHAFAAAPFLLKMGLLNDLDLQVGITPYLREHIRDRESGEHSTSEGVGDTIVRLKQNVWGNDSGSSAFAIMPYLKIPTARGDLGNGDLEGGLILPYGLSIDNEHWIYAMAQVDVLRSADDDRYVGDLVHSVTTGQNLVGSLDAYVEYAGFVNLSNDALYRAYADAGLTYGINSNVQVDCGLRVGLSKAADDVGAFVGISVRR